MIQTETEDGYPVNIPCSFYEYSLLKIIGNGSTSVVALVQNEKDLQLYAAKIIPKSYIEYSDLMKSIQNEIKVMKQIDHPNIIKIYKTFELKNRYSESYIVLIIEYCENGDLLTYFTENGFKNELQKKKIISGFLRGIKYLHERGISHGDIKPENILLDGNFNPKLSDFGYCRTSKIANDDEKRGTVNYAAPELFTKGEFDALKTDIWAIGITIYCLSENNFPYKNGNLNFVVNQIVSGKLCLNKNAPSILRNLVERCTDLIPMNRPSIDELINDKYFSNTEMKSN